MTMETAESQRASVIPGRVPPEELNLFDHLRVLFRHRWMIFLVCIMAVLATGLTSFLSEPTYVARASIVPPMNAARGDSGLGVGLLGGGGASLLRKVMDVSSVVDMYVGILQSRAVSDAVVDRFDLMRVYEVGSSRHRARAVLQGGTSLDVSDDRILYITVEDKDPNRAAAIANAYIEELDRLNKKLSAGQTTSKRVFLETRLRDMETNLSRQDIPSREEKIQEMLYELLMRELEVAKIEEAKSMPTIQVLDSAIPPERRKARRTVGKAMVAGVVAFICAVFVAFIREYWVVCSAPRSTAPSQEASNRALPREHAQRPGPGEARVPPLRERRSRSSEPDSEPVEMS
jgi:uncharacterized protein involved in exopolysaccharide biosynthesis